MLGSRQKLQASGDEHLSSAAHDALAMPAAIIDQWAGGWSDRLRIDVTADRRDMPTPLSIHGDQFYLTDHTA